MKLKVVMRRAPAATFFIVKIASWGFSCQVVAPSIIPQKPGNRVKTDFKDAENIAYQFRNGSLSFVHLPEVEEEEVQTLVRCRGAFKETTKRVKLQIHAFLKTQGLNIPSKLGSAKCEAWFKELSLSEPMDDILTEFRTHLEYLNFRITEMDLKIDRISQTEPYAKNVKVLQTLKGLSVLSSMILITEIIDFKRFPKKKIRKIS